MKKFITKLSLIGLIACNYSYADITTREFRDICYKSDYACSIYIKGYFDGFNIGQFFKYTDKIISVGTTKDIFMKYIKDHPEDGDEDISKIISKLLFQNDVIEFKPKALEEIKEDMKKQESQSKEKNKK